MNDTLTRTLNTHYRKPKKCVVHKTQADEKQHKNHKNHNTPQKTKKKKDTIPPINTGEKQCALEGYVMYVSY